MKIGVKSILIIHPEGNVYNNPHLYEVIRSLSKDYRVKILVPNIAAIQSSDEFSNDLIPFHARYLEFFERGLRSYVRFAIVSCLLKWSYLRRQSFDIIIGVDQIGLINAYFMSRLFRVPYAFVSYEIFFKDECRTFEKRLEIIASRKVAFAIVQDGTRAKHLSIENQIPLDRMVTMPVASAFTRPYQKDFSIYDELGIPKDKKILLYFGSVASWTCMDQLMQKLSSMPDDWVILLHDRYGNTKQKLDTLEVDARSIENRLLISDMEITDTQQAYRLLHCADVGLSLYCPDYLSKYTGKNLTYVGLASGKTSTYLQNGLPVITTENHVLKLLEPDEGILYFIESVDDLFDVLKDFKISSDNNQKCIEFFNNHLSFDIYRQELHHRVHTAIHSHENA